MGTGTVLVVNAGSSSLKLRVLDARDELVATRDLPPADDPEPGLREFLADAPAADLAGHRVVHGGTDLTAAALVDAQLEEQLEQLSELAPLHNPPAVSAIHALRALRPDLPAVACFDTAFHSGLPPQAATYALPAAWAGRWPLRRFGFHGLSFAYATRRAGELLQRAPDELRLVIAHLGAGASLAAVAGGRSVDTTMGFTPLEGLVMATRSGSVDPGLLLWVQRHGRIEADGAERALDREAGLLGLSGRSGDLRELEAAAGNGDAGCRLAIDVYLHRLASCIAAMTASLGGIDALVFTAGVGENSPLVRREACRRLAYLGLGVEADANEHLSGDRVISPPGGQASALVIEAREDLEIARQARATVRRTPPS